MRPPSRGTARAQVTVRAMRPDDIGAGVALCRASHWNQTAREWEFFLRVAGEHAVVAELDGRVVGTAVTVPHDERVGWIAMVLVDPSCRGRGVGHVLLEHAIDTAPAGTALRLDATPAGRTLYLSLGFEDEYGLARWRRVDPRPPSPPIESQVRVRPFRDDDWTAVSTIDRAAFGADRRLILEWARAGAPHLAWVAEHDEAVCGFVFGRSGHDAEHVGPVVARTAGAAISLATAALSRAGARPVLIDALEAHAEFCGWLRDGGFAVERPFTRMRRGAVASPGDPGLVYAIAGPELG